MTVNGGGEVMTDTGLQLGCLDDEIPGVFRFANEYETLFSIVTPEEVYFVDIESLSSF